MKRPKKNPFRTPEFYFDSIEDRIMGDIEYRVKKKTPSSKIFLFLKPALGLAASFALIYLLVYYPINNLLLKNTAQVVVADSTAHDLFEAYAPSFSLIDENSLVNAIFSDETSNVSEINEDEMLAYLSSGMNDIEIYSEIQN